MKSIIPLEEINQDFPAKQTFIYPTKYQNLGVEFQKDPVAYRTKRRKSSKKYSPSLDSYKWNDPYSSW